MESQTNGSASLERQKLVLLGVIGLLFSISFAITLNRIPFIRLKSDIYLRWYATTKLLQEGRNLYDPRNGQEVLAYVYGDNPIRDSTNFYYPAHLLLFTGPLALLSYPNAHLIWTTLVQLFYWKAIAWAMRVMQWPRTANQVTVFLLAATLFLPSLQHTIWGQFNTIGVLSLVLCFTALRVGRFGLAGLLAAGLTIKPQMTVIPLLYLLFWCLFQRERWRFYFGFAFTMLALWLITEIIQPGWIFDFWAAINNYPPQPAALDLLWNPHQIFSALLLGICAFAFWKIRNVPATSLAFAVCLALTTAVGILIVPFAGVMHAVIIPIPVIFVLAGLRQTDESWYRVAFVAFTLIFALGYVGFGLGFALNKDHMYLPDLAHKTFFPLLIVLATLPLCFSREHLQLRIEHA